MKRLLNYKNALYNSYHCSNDMPYDGPQSVPLYSDEIKSIPAWIATLNRFYNHGGVGINQLIEMLSNLEPAAIYTNWTGAPTSYKYEDTFVFVPKVLRKERFEQGLDGWHNVVSPDSPVTKQSNYVSYMNYMANLKSIMLLNMKKKKLDSEIFNRGQTNSYSTVRYKKLVRLYFFQNLCQDAINSIQGSVFMVNVKEKTRWIRNQWIKYVIFH